MQLWSLAPVAASVIYCIGDDGHAAFELMKAGARGCAACCHDEVAELAAAPQDDEASSVAEAPVSECTDVAMAPFDGVATKSDAASPAPLVALLPARIEAPLYHRELARSDIAPPRGSPTRMLRRTVLLI